MKHSSAGFTFLELMISLLIISILAALAYPVYTRHQLTANREQAKQLLLSCATELSLYYKTRQSYEDIAPDPLPSKLQGVCNTPYIQTLKHSSYQLQALLADKEQYQLIAQRQGTQRQDSCGDLILDQTGKKRQLNAENISIEDCW